MLHFPWVPERGNDEHKHDIHKGFVYRVYDTHVSMLPALNIDENRDIWLEVIPVLKAPPEKERACHDIPQYP